ncbi:hypothetical protein PbJCM13498_14780 [Prolixibacter bellariivorans]|uniref:Glycine zipper family protein n=1 Tax=Prolixibacter bellariivorans TaxID=314319 RepID=A0A5M4AXH8_9BACT|nr:hypothetical protein [Prolixibacter bellariivorans]GET32615.1 hypothetical protein PbJCM13498_14780 [Prolixibacter bellariivorans]
MTFTELNRQPSGREMKNYTQFTELIEELKKRTLPDEMMELINQEIERLNSVSEKDFARQLVKSKAYVVKELEKRLKLVPKSYYRNLWTAIGMAAFGLPIGVVIGQALGNIAYLGVGLPIGLAIGAGVGTQMDKKAKEEGRQLDVVIG